MTSTSSAYASLRGLALGDALGAQFFVPDNLPKLTARLLPDGIWPWTDDTEMACVIHAELTTRQRIDQDALAKVFAVRHDFDRGYGPSTNRMLRLVREGGDWRTLAAEPFDGQGSWGNGAAMRVAPLGAWFADDLDAVVEQAALSAAVTHTHPEGIAGAVAVAVAAAGAVTLRRPSAGEFVTYVRARTPVGLVRERLGAALDLVDRQDARAVGRILGNGRQVSAPDTVPFAVWSAARHLDDYAAAFWDTASAGGDVDTTCAIVGGIVGARAELPAGWAARVEELPHWWRAEVGDGGGGDLGD
ncbi:ADP-ribosylglycohydrolase family protein [Embleya sp. NBC_00896]|uniref:ADP-ribosylglycohydrolase family protein n=1 Tax=Embleya sp. NBC_00896 TaxID=2975961 RepID=UPI0038696FD0|nr:ADP-ribosylglycohydrolase family protein [Embleya sp. NBC_00896]